MVSSRLELRADVAQRIARAGGDDAEIGVGDPRVGAQLPAGAVARELGNARLLDLRAGALGALEQHVVQIEARIDQQRLVELEAHLAGARGGQHGLA